MTLIRTSLLNAIAVVVKMATLLGINKILAIYVGPVGYAAIGQFQNAIQMVTIFAGGAVNTGVTKYTAEYHYDENKQRLVWRTAGTIALAGSLLSGVLITLCSQLLASWLLKDVAYAGVFIWFGATLVLFTFNTLLLAILNGKKAIPTYVAANVAGSLFALIVTAILSNEYGLYGSLVALAVYQSISFFITLFLCYKSEWFKVRYLIGYIHKPTALNLGKYAAMALTSAACMPLSQVLVRNHLGDTLGWETAGYWEAMWRLSAAYLLLVTTTLSVYYLPRLAELKNASDIRVEIVQGYKIILPVAAASGLVIYLLRDFIIGVLFTPSFMPMRELFGWQMVGDTLKIGSWVVAYLMLSKAMFKSYILLEIFFAASFLILAKVMVAQYGAAGVVIAYTMNYALYWLFTVFAVRKYLFGRAT
jgi:PST family polysaccharide transporter